jgi:NAD+ kinase
MQHTGAPGSGAADMTKTSPGGGRAVLLVAHTGRPRAARTMAVVVQRLVGAGITVRLLADEAPTPAVPGTEVIECTDAAAKDCELVLTLGGDGTLLRGAELARPTGTPLLGINLGHVGFLAEAEAEDQALAATVDRIIDREYDVEQRMTVDVRVLAGGVEVHRDWALNEASVEKASRERMLELMVEVDGRPLSRWGCDGVVCATPTGSTAYAFSAGGPIVWPEVEALLLVPISAHALFARPLVVSPESVIAMDILDGVERCGVVWCDGRRTTDLPRNARIEVRRGELPVRLARLHPAPFTDRLVAKFRLPVKGWRGDAEQQDAITTEPPQTATPDGE